jgi:lysophospholipase L1-like esterase
MNRILQNAIMLAASGIVALIAGEVIVRLFVPVRNVGPTFSSYDPYYGKVLKKSFTCTRITPEFAMRFTTNSYGHRGPEPERFPSHPVLFLGDSFTSGYGVNDGEEFPDLIRDELERRTPAPHIPVVNAGSGNIGNGYWLRFLKSEGPRYDPRLVVLGFCANDFFDNVNEGVYTLTEAGQLKEDTTVHFQEDARKVQRLIEAVPGLAYSHLVGLARQAYADRTTPDADPASPGGRDHAFPGDELTYRLVSEVLALCTQKSWPAVVLAIDTAGSRLKRLRTLCAEYRVPVLVPPSKTDRPELYYVVDGHWNAAGHRVVKDMLLNLIERDSLLSF